MMIVIISLILNCPARCLFLLPSAINFFSQTGRKIWQKSSTLTNNSSKLLARVPFKLFFWFAPTVYPKANPLPYPLFMLCCKDKAKLIKRWHEKTNKPLPKCYRNWLCYSKETIATISPQEQSTPLYVATIGSMCFDDVLSRLQLQRYGRLALG